LISVDLPGFGLTRAPETFRIGSEAYVTALEQFAEARGLDRFTLIGSSMGGAAAWQYTLAHPERLEALVLVAAAGWRRSSEERSGDGPVIFRILSNPLGAAVTRDLDSTAFTAQGLRAAVVNDLLITPAMVRRYVDMSRAPGRRAQILESMNGERAEYATPERLAAIRTPTLVMTGELDAIVPAAHARRFAAAIPGATLIAYPPRRPPAARRDPGALGRRRAGVPVRGGGRR
jgi:pimeloyl-ACP methyl ester carboxylesterase